MIVSNWSNIGIALCAVAVVHVLFSMFFSSKRNHLRGKHVLITGGSKGLGLALAREFLRRGCNVTVVARNQTDLLEALQNLDAYAKSLSLTPKLQALRADTTSTEELAAAFSAAEASAGPIQVLFANAGLSIPGLFVDQPLSDFEKQVEVNYLGVVRAIKCVLPGMLTRRDGYVVITASMAAVLGMAGYTSYAPTKWALRGLADCLHNEVGFGLLML
jgi:3-dehydrosphinganine reductase